MKKVEAIVRPLKLEEVKIALGEIGVTGMSVSDVRGYGTSARQDQRGRISPLDTPIRSRIEIVARDEDVEEIVTTIETYARTGEPGDGLILVSPMGDAIRVRTEERGDQVL
jgi:nitrogen regulatory protein P-II 1